jgi:5-methylcytosine-specific restriction endonuclease McrA
MVSEWGRLKKKGIVDLDLLISSLNEEEEFEDIIKTQTEEIKIKMRKAFITRATKKSSWNAWVECGIDDANTTCPICKAKLNVWDSHYGHIKSEKNGGDMSVENIIPICMVCNTSIGSKNLDEICKERNIPFPFKRYRY